VQYRTLEAAGPFTTRLIQLDMCETGHRCPDYMRQYRRMAVARVSVRTNRRTAKKEQPSIDVSIERDGKLHTGSYTVADGVITVRSRAGSIATHVGTSSVVRMAQLLLLQLAAEQRRETAAINALVISRRGEASDKSVVRQSQIVTMPALPDIEEIAKRLDRIQELADALATCDCELLSRMDGATRLQVEIVAARLALKLER
jgi:hypothetical protein